MRTVGFAISRKENEKRRALLPHHIDQVQNKSKLYFEEGYGEVFGISDEEYLAKGVNVVSFEDILTRDVICDPKIGDADYLVNLREGQIIFGWIHAVQNKSITDSILANKASAIAWEDMFEGGRHVFWRNNELAGEAAVMHAFTLYGKVPYECNVAILGKGNVARGAYKTLTSLGARVSVYDRRMEGLLRNELEQYDIIVNGVLWDVYRRDHIIYRDDLPRMRKPAMIIDISCDQAGAIETSIPTTIENPVYYSNGVLHYAVDHTPALISHSVTKALGDELVQYLDFVIEEKVDQNETLQNALIIEKGQINDQRIIDYQRR